MASLIYVPAITVRIRASSMKNSIIDVSEDIQTANIVRTLGPSLSTLDLTLLNNGRKYDNAFETMDAVVVYLRRLKTMLCFTGYLDTSPKFAAVPGSVRLSASCTLKRLQYFYWDPGTQAALDLAKTSEGMSNAQDGGLARKARDLLTDVAGWSKEQIHISQVPSNWFERISKLADTLASEAEAIQMANEVGSQAYIAGTNPTEQSGSTVHTGGLQNDSSLPIGPNTLPGIGPGTGALPTTSGKISSFGGPGGGAYGSFGLTGESGVHPHDHYYCAMRWPYDRDNAVPGAKKWWTNRRILVVNPANHKAVVLRAADWGPASWTHRAIDVSPWAISALGAATDDTVNIGFAQPNTPLGLVTAPVSGGGEVGSTSATASANSGWGSAGDFSKEQGVKAAGITFTVNKKAAASFQGFVADLVKTFGYHPQSIGGFSDRGNRSNPKVKSAHAYGAAIDIDSTRNPRYTSGPPWGSYALPHDTKALITLARKWGLGWGGEWHHTKDYMHFEFIGGPGTATYDGVAATAQDNGGNWTTPVIEPFTITARFGDQGAHWSHAHSGTDFACSEGTRIRPVGPGIVHDIGYDASDYGNHISVDHGTGTGVNHVYTFYAHMKDPSPLAIGDPVDSISSTLGYVDSTGNVTGPHVHLELRLDADTYQAALASGGPDKYVLGANPSPPPRGVPGSELSSADAQSLGATNTSGSDLSNVGGGLFNVWQWINSSIDTASTLLFDSRALMNDVPIMGAVSDYMTTGMRDFCSAPNGDFIGWFPDYYGFYGQAGKMIITPLEIDADNPPTIFHNDAALKTHQYVVGSTFGGKNDATDIIRETETAGIVSVEDPAVLEALLHVSTAQAEAISKVYLNRYGARPELKSINAISGSNQEFYFACMEFIRNWSQQYQTSINVTFMPEAYPGMLACFPYYGIQGYIREVSHSIDLTGNGGFRTQISAAPWSTIGSKGPSGLPKGGGL